MPGGSRIGARQTAAGPSARRLGDYTKNILIVNMNVDSSMAAIIV